MSLKTRVQILDYAPPPRPRISVAAMFAYAGFLIVLLHLLFFHLAPDAPMHSASIPRQAALLGKVSAIISAASGGRAMEYHVAAAPSDWEANGKFFTAIYFNAVYNQYPQPVWVGEGNAIINYPVDIQRADHVPSDLWLRQHQVASVVSLMAGDENGPRVSIHQVP